MGLNSGKVEPKLGFKFQGLKRSPDNNFRVSGYPAEIYIVEYQSASNGVDVLTTNLKKIHEIQIYLYDRGGYPSVPSIIADYATDTVITCSGNKVTFVNLVNMMPNCGLIIVLGSDN